MKKLLIILCLLPIMASAQKIELLPKIAVSYTNERMRITDEMNNSRYTYSFPNLCFRTGLEAKYKRLSVYYDTKIWCSEKGFKFTPKQAAFSVGASLKITSKVKVSYEHTCYHAVTSDNECTKPAIYGGKDEISISYGY